MKNDQKPTLSQQLEGLAQFKELSEQSAAELEAVANDLSSLARSLDRGARAVQRQSRAQDGKGASGAHLMDGQAISRANLANALEKVEKILGFVDGLSVRTCQIADTLYGCVPTNPQEKNPPPHSSLIHALHDKLDQLAGMLGRVSDHVDRTAEATGLPSDRPVASVSMPPSGRMR